MQIHKLWLSQCLLCSASQGDSHTLNCGLGKANLSHTLQSDHWHEDGLHTKIWIAAFTEVHSKKTLCSNRSTAWSRVLSAPVQSQSFSPTDMFTYRHTNIHADKCTHSFTNWQDILPSPQLCGLHSDSKLQCVRCVSASPLLYLGLPFSHSLLNL